MKFNLLTYSYVTSLYKFLSIVFLHQSHFIFYFCIILYTVTVYSILTQLFQLLVKTSFVQSKYWANKFVNLSSPISLAFNFKCYFILLILIYNKIQLSLKNDIIETKPLIGKCEKKVVVKHRRFGHMTVLQCERKLLNYAIRRFSLTLKTSCYTANFGIDPYS